MKALSGIFRNPMYTLNAWLMTGKSKLLGDERLEKIKIKIRNFHERKPKSQYTSKVLWRDLSAFNFFLK